MASYQELKESIIAMDEQRVKQLTRSYLDKGAAATSIMLEGLIPAMSVVGQKMKTGEMFIPEVLAAAQAMRAGMEMIKPLLAAGDTELYAGKIVVGTVQGDLHNIGKNIVILLLESGGFSVVDAGVDVPVDKFVELVEKERPNILGLSALMTTTMPMMKNVIQALDKKGLRDKVRVMIGGAPVSQGFAGSIGADGYAPDAVSAVDEAKKLLAMAGSMPA